MPPSSDPPRAPLVTIRGLSKRFKTRTELIRVLEGVDLDVAEGEFVSVLGPSGCGKSTLLQIVAGLEPPSEGRVDVQRGDLAYVFQRPLLLPWRDVLDNVTFAAECRGVRARDVRAEALALLDTMGLADARHLRPAELSVGMRQRVDLARALLVKPRLLLMDEPFASLDAATHHAMVDELQRHRQRLGFAVLFVSHDADEVAALSDRVVHLSAKPTRVLRVEPRPA